MKTDHKQVTLFTADGMLVDVDEGIRDLLRKLNTMGVHTQFSCENAIGRAYVIADTKSFRPVLRAMRKQMKNGAYSSKAAEFCSALFRFEPLYSFELTIALHGVYHEWRYVFRKHQFEYVNLIEKIYNNKFGIRTCLRWAPELTGAFLQALQETSFA